MKSRKFLAVLVVVSLWALPAFGELKTGILSRSWVSEEELSAMVPQSWLWSLVAPEHGGEISYKYYDTMNAMIMGLNSGEVDEIDVPQAVGEYILSTNPEYEISCAMRSRPTNYAFGFLRGERGEGLCEKFNEALVSLMRSGKFSDIQEKYIYTHDFDAIVPVEFAKFESADRITVAVTGDLPPVDYVDAGGNAAGFNTAILAEIGRVLGLNVKLVNIGHSGKTAALTSGRVDVVFWYRYLASNDDIFRLEVPEQVILSNPYYMTDIFVHVRKK